MRIEVIPKDEIKNYLEDESVYVIRKSPQTGKPVIKCIADATVKVIFGGLGYIRLVSEPEDEVEETEE